MPISVTESVVKDGIWLVKISSAFGEELSFPEAPNGISHIRIDLSELKYLNSIGIRDWMLWTKKLEHLVSPSKEPVTITLTHLRVAFLKLVDLVFQIVPKSAKIESFFISYSCLDCFNTETKIVQNNRATLASEPLLTEGELPPCKICGFQTELDLSARFYRDLLKFTPFES